MNKKELATFINVSIFQGVKEFRVTNGQWWRFERDQLTPPTKEFTWRCSLRVDDGLGGYVFIHTCHILASKNPKPAKLYAAMLDD
jgi:hypothetical protein